MGRAAIVSSDAAQTPASAWRSERLAGRSKDECLSSKPGMRAGVPRGACLVSEAIELENGAPLAVGFTHLAGLCFARELIAAGARSPCVELLWRA
jgi:hypothetical protein